MKTGVDKQGNVILDCTEIADRVVEIALKKLGDIGIHYHCDRCGKSIDHYGLCEECYKWFEDNYGEGKKNV